ncbi:hypothetical protein NDU88_007021 [Pleurodeles waltl]|uniref:Uncharacterized protein n=1 Tax=Pleurodeles waltl TaxID=8319 RepID=A0AAV7QMS0_PLEWA|nr:hypothetical protein NDU88_007021 [Pleurodeles waltl]
MKSGSACAFHCGARRGSVCRRDSSRFRNVAENQLDKPEKTEVAVKVKRKDTQLTKNQDASWFLQSVFGGDHGHCQPPPSFPKRKCDSTRER